MKEPLVWFVLIGGLLFAADRYQGPAPIVIDEAVKTQIANLWQTQMGVSPTEKELDSLVHNWVREEIFFREALRLGLDSEDTIIRRRLVQKLGFIAQDVFDLVAFNEYVTCFFGTFICLKAEISEPFIMAQDKGDGFFPVHMDLIRVPGADLMGVNTRSVPECDL